MTDTPLPVLGDRLRVPTVEELRAMPPKQRRELIRWATPRLVEDFTPVVPHPPQQLFLWMNNLEAFFGGSGGGGKSIALLLAALQFVDVPGYQALILRRTYQDLALPGALMDRARELLIDTPAKPVDGGRAWVFPSGARLHFGYAQYYNEIYRYRSSEWSYVGFDELTAFEERTYLFMFARLRRPAVPCLTCHLPLRRGDDGVWRHREEQVEGFGPVAAGCGRPKVDQRALARYPPAPDGTTVFDVPLRMRSASNPGGVGHCVPYGEVLTPAGWWPIDQLKVGDPVYQVSADGVVELTVVRQAHCHQTTEIVEVRGRGLHMDLTPWHRVAKVGGVRRDTGRRFSLVRWLDLPGQTTILRSVDWKGEPLIEVTVPSHRPATRRLMARCQCGWKQVRRRRRTLPCPKCHAPVNLDLTKSLGRSGRVRATCTACAWAGWRVPKHPSLPCPRCGDVVNEVVRESPVPQPTRLTGERYAALLGWFLAEGWLVPTHKAIGIAQTRPGTRAKLRALLEDCGFRFSDLQRGFILYAADWYRHFAAFNFGMCHQKYIPDFARNADRRELRALFNALVDGDGHWQSAASGTFYSTSPRLADDFQEVAVKLGYVTSVRSRDRTDGAAFPSGRVASATRPCFEVSFKRTRSGGTELLTGHHVYKVATRTQRRSRVQMRSGPRDVFCIGVDSGAFLLRQQGSVWVSGNSWCRDRFVNPVTRDPSTVFVPARLSDNPSLDAPTYMESLAHLDPVERARILDGDWSVTDQGKMFKRHWFPVVEQMPAGARARMVRYWDFAATEVRPGKDPDWTAGALLGFLDGVWYVVDMRRVQVTPRGVEQLVAQTAVQDGRRVSIWIEQEPGAPIWVEESVLCADGAYRRLGDIAVGDEVIGRSGRPCRVTAVHEQGVISALRIATRTGRSVVAAPDHPFLTPEGWRLAGDLQVGDILGLLSRPGLEGKVARTPIAEEELRQRMADMRQDGLAYGEIAVRLTTEGVPTRSGSPWRAGMVWSLLRGHRAVPAEWKAEDARLAGYFVGDGACGPVQAVTASSCSAIACRDPVERADIEHCVSTLGFNLREGERRGDLRLTGGIQGWLRATGLAGRRSYDKRVPSWVMTAPNWLAAEFLGAYFACDGHLDQKKRTAEFYSVSRALLEDVQRLLLRFGVNSSLAPKNGRYGGRRHQSWRLSLLNGDDAAWRFVARVPIHHSHKVSLLSEIGQTRTRFDEPFLPDRVVSVEPAGNLPCRCLTVADDESFTVRDLVVHNSGKAVIDYYRRRVLPGFEVRGNPVSGSKTERARPVSAAAEAGNVVLVEGAWNRAFLDEAELFPTPGVHDDQIDAVSGGIEVMSLRVARLRA